MLEELGLIWIIFGFDGYTLLTPETYHNPYLESKMKNRLPYSHELSSRSLKDTASRA
jgi:hypothetical protein